MADSEIMKALDAQREAFAAFQEAVKNENKEAAANAEKAYNEAKDRANNLQASIDTQNKRLEKIETDLATAATLGGKNGASDLTPKQQEYQTAFASALRGNYSKDRMFSLGREAYGALVEKDNASGGFLVTPQLSSRIIGGLAVHNPMRSVATVENISSPTLEIIADPEDMDADWMDETTTANEKSYGKFYKHEIPTNFLRVRARISRALLADTAYDLEGRLVAKVTKAFAKKERDAHISGDGVKKPKGLFTVDPSAYDGSEVAYGVWEYLASGNASTMGTNLDVFLDLIDAVPSEYRANAKWMMRRATFTALKKLKKSSTFDGYLIWEPSFQPGVPDKFLGYPMIENESCPEVAAGKLPIAFGDFAEGYTIADREGMFTIIDTITDDRFIIYKFFRRTGAGPVDSRAIKFLKVAAN